MQCFDSKSSNRLYNVALLQNGDLCISILHPPVDDPQSGELPCERWNPTQNVRYLSRQMPLCLVGFFPLITDCFLSQDNLAVSGEPSQWAQHFQPCQRGRLSDVQEVEGVQRQRQRIRAHYQVCHHAHTISSLQFFVILKAFFVLCYSRSTKSQHIDNNTMHCTVLAVHN